jgi:hypothetical protein
LLCPLRVHHGFPRGNWQGGVNSAAYVINVNENMRRLVEISEFLRISFPLHPSGPPGPDMAIRLQGWRLAGLGLEKEFLLCWTFPQLQARPRLSLVRSPGGDMHAGPDGQWSAVSQSYWKLTRFFPTEIPDWSALLSPRIISMLDQFKGCLVLPSKSNSTYTFPHIYHTSFFRV